MLLMFLCATRQPARYRNVKSVNLIKKSFIVIKASPPPLQVQPVAELVELSVRQSVDGRELTLHPDQIQSGTLKRSPSKGIVHQVVSTTGHLHGPQGTVDFFYTMLFGYTSYYNNVFFLESHLTL